MSTISKRSAIFATGLAMFAMFFGAGNIVFPLALGQFALNNNFYGILGLVVTAILVPILGIFGMLLYNGDYNAFFKRIGKIPGFLIITMILLVIGPFGGIPRCMTISYSTLTAFGIEGFAGLNLPLFSLLCAAIIFLFTIRPNKILSLLGYVLTPILLLSLLMIAIKGAWMMPSIEVGDHTKWQTFSHGIFTGYQTMDLLAAFFFSSMVLLCLRQNAEKSGIDPQQRKPLFKIALFGGLIAAALLALVYVSFSFIAAGFSSELALVANHELLGQLAYTLLGPYAGLIAGIAVTFACLTTEIALTAIFAEFLRKTLCKEKISYVTALLITLFTSFLVSTLHFEGITALLGPMLEIFYPALIVLLLLNILHKLYNIQIVKPIFYGAVVLSTLAYLLL